MTKNTELKSKKIAVAMSGGVDSGTTAYLLKKQGFDVAGFHFKFWKEKKDQESEKAARETASLLKIPFKILNFEEAFYQRVVCDFINQYSQGKTPNPCVICNQIIKFGLVLDKIQKQGFDFLATGHYAQIKKENDRFHLLKGKDKTRDQSYFLYRLNQNQLSKVIFPLGDHLKSGVRKMAQREKLPVAKRPESREICFIPKEGYQKFLLDKKPMIFKTGPILNQKGNIIGKHKGLPHYTIGQRKGLETTINRPLYVLGFDLEKNALIIGNKKDLEKNDIIIREANWILGYKPKEDLKHQVKIRSQGKEAPCLIKEIEKSRFQIKLLEKMMAVAPGQSAVIYDQDEVLGGGIII